MVLDSVGSTNAEAARSVGGPLWVAARQQTAGRGRMGRGWSTEHGNLAASLRLPETPPQAATLSFATALAVSDMLEETAGIATRLKWPNDVLVDGRKVAGILLESGLDDGAMVVGIGVNLRHAPSGVDTEAVSVRELVGSAPEFDDALDSLAGQWSRWHCIWKSDFGEVRNQWLERAAFLGEQIRARLPLEEVRGRFDGLDADGALLLSTDEGTRRIGAGEVSPLPAEREQA